MDTKTIKEDATTRIYRTPDGAAVWCTIQHQRAYDPDDGQEAGYHGWCGLVDDQSDYVLGPYESAAAVFAAYEKRNKDYQRAKGVTLYPRRAPKFHGLPELPPPKVTRLHRKCMMCFKQIPAHWPSGDIRPHCDACIDGE